jgi:hypothetical protein
VCSSDLKEVACDPTPAGNGFASRRQHAHSSVIEIVNPLTAIPGGGFSCLALDEWPHADLADWFGSAYFAAGVI